MRGVFFLICLIVDAVEVGIDAHGKLSYQSPSFANRVRRVAHSAAATEKEIRDSDLDGSQLRRRMNNELNFPPNFERLVLGCIDADFFIYNNTPTSLTFPSSLKSYIYLLSTRLCSKT